MNSIGSTIKHLRKAMNVTQDEMARQLGVTYQAVSKWENETSVPDTMMLPALASYLGVSIDELFGYNLQVMTNKEKLISFMAKNGILCRDDSVPANDAGRRYYINSEQFTTNAQISKLGEVFADCIQENHLQSDTIAGLAYHGIAFAAATAVSLYSKYGVTAHFCHDRKVPDSRGRTICGHTPSDGEQVVVIDDIITSGRTLDRRIQQMHGQADMQLEAVIVIADLSHQGKSPSPAARLLQERYGAKLYSILTDEDIQSAITKRLITL